jgi:4-carboxymuconolactone decarboxylase
MNSTANKAVLAALALLCCTAAQAAPIKKGETNDDTRTRTLHANLVLGELWQRPGLSPRDRSIVTLSVLVAKNQAHELPFYLNRALDSGVKPGEIAELITHLAFYSRLGQRHRRRCRGRAVFADRQDRCWPAAAGQARAAAAGREGRSGAREDGRGKLRPDRAGRRAVHDRGPVPRPLAAPGLAPRDRSLVTVSALVANGQVAQVTYHLNRAMDNGLTEAAGVRSADPAGLLCRLAERVLGHAGLQGRLRKTKGIIMQLKRVGSQPSMKGPPKTGSPAPCGSIC